MSKWHSPVTVDAKQAAAQQGNLLCAAADQHLAQASLNFLLRKNQVLDRKAGVKQRISWVKSMSGAVGHKRVAKDFIDRYPISVPPLPEQRRIVGILDGAFEGIATAKSNAEKNLQNARALFESHLQSVFTQHGKGWKEKRLKEVATTLGRGKSRHRPRNATHLYSGRYPFVQTDDIRKADHIITDCSQTYSEAGLAQSKLWPKGTICITIAANIAET